MIVLEKNYLVKTFPVQHMHMHVVNIQCFTVNTYNACWAVSNSKCFNKKLNVIC